MSTPESIVVSIPTEEIRDWDSFYAICARVLGFPDFYGRNMNAWIDCMTSIDHPEHGMTAVHAAAGTLAIQLGDCTNFAQRCPEQYEVILDSAAFVNYRRIDLGDRPVLAISCFNREPLRTRTKT